MNNTSSVNVNGNYMLQSENFKTGASFTSFVAFFLFFFFFKLNTIREAFQTFTNS